MKRPVRQKGFGRLFPAADAISRKAYKKESVVSRFLFYIKTAAELGSAALLSKIPLRKKVYFFTQRGSVRKTRGFTLYFNESIANGLKNFKIFLRKKVYFFTQKAAEKPLKNQAIPRREGPLALI